MFGKLTVSVVIPALDEEASVGKVVADLFALSDASGRQIVDHIVVCDNGSTDQTATRARAAGAEVVFEPAPGYGRACQAAIRALPESDVVLFVDADDSCVAEQGVRLLEGIAGGADLAIGSRALGRREPGALTVPQRFGNWLAARLIRLFWRETVTDLGPFRAIRHDALRRIDMQDETFGWTVEMQVKAIQNGLVIEEFPVDSRVRTGTSKISGTVRGTAGAARGILGTIFRLRLQQYGYEAADVRK